MLQAPVVGTVGGAGGGQQPTLGASMTNSGLVFWVAFFGIMVFWGAVVSGVYFFANLKLYTEIMKEKAQRTRGAASYEEIK